MTGADRPDWIDPQYRAHRERQRENRSRELSRVGQSSKSERMSLCCTKKSVSGLACCGERERVHWNTCGVHGCPICGGHFAKADATALWQACKELLGWGGHARMVPKGYTLKHLVLTSRSGASSGAFTVEQARRDLVKLHDSTKKLYQALCSFNGGASAPAGMVAFPEAGANGMLHVHCLIIAPWLVQETLALWWYQITGWGSRTGSTEGERARRRKRPRRSARNAPRAPLPAAGCSGTSAREGDFSEEHTWRGHISVGELYYYDTPSKKARAKELERAGDFETARKLRTHGTNRKSISEICKYLVKPTSSPEVAAIVAAAMAGDNDPAKHTLDDRPGPIHRRWRFGLFRKIACSARARAKRCPAPIEEGPPEGRCRHCGEPLPKCEKCGHRHPVRIHTPFKFAGELAGGRINGCVELHRVPKEDPGVRSRASPDPDRGSRALSPPPHAPGDGLWGLRA